MKRLTSRQNPLVARCRLAARGETPGLVLLDGAHLIAEALSAGLTVRDALVRTDAAAQPEVAGLIDRLERSGVQVASTPAAVMDAVSPVRSSSGLVALADRPADGDDRLFRAAAPLLAVACDIQDPGNLGAIIRVAEAAGAAGAVAAGRSADPFGWKALRGSMGSALRLPVARSPSAPDIIGRIRGHGCRIVATVPRSGRTLFDADLTGPVAVLIGSEGAGLPAALVDLADLRVSVPMTPPVESLNAAVTAALLLYEARRQRAGAGG